MQGTDSGDKKDMMHLEKAGEESREAGRILKLKKKKKKKDLGENRLLSGGWWGKSEG